MYEAGKDVEYWNGFYGTRFANERIVIKMSESVNQTNLLDVFEINALPVRELPVWTSFD